MSFVIQPLRALNHNISWIFCNKTSLPQIVQPKKKRPQMRPQTSRFSPLQRHTQPVAPSRYGRYAARSSRRPAGCPRNRPKGGKKGLELFGKSFIDITNARDVVVYMYICICICILAISKNKFNVYRVSMYMEPPNCRCFWNLLSNMDMVNQQILQISWLPHIGMMQCQIFCMFMCIMDGSLSKRLTILAWLFNVLINSHAESR